MYKIIIFLLLASTIEAATCKITYNTNYKSKIDEIVKVIKKNAVESVTDEGLNVEKSDEEIRFDIENETYLITETKSTDKDKVIFEYYLQNGGKLERFEAKITYTAQENGTKVENYIEAKYIDSGITSLSLDILIRSQIIKIHKKTKRALGEIVSD